MASSEPCSLPSARAAAASAAVAAEDDEEDAEDSVDLVDSRFRPPFFWRFFLPRPALVPDSVAANSFWLRLSPSSSPPPPPLLL